MMPGPTHRPTAMSPDDLLGRIAVEQAILHLFDRLDADDAAGVAEAFASDGVWHHGGRASIGPAAVAAEMGRRPTGRRTVHLVSNLVVVKIGPVEARVTFNTLTYAGPTPPDPQPAVLELPIALDRYACVLTNDGGVWLVTRLESERLFAPAR